MPYLKFFTKKKSLFLFSAAILLAGGVFAFSYVLAVSAGVSITPATNGENISIDTTSNGGTGDYVSLDGPAITETSAGAITAGTHTLTLPAGWEFDTSSHIAIFKFGGNIVLGAGSSNITPNANSFSFVVTTASTNISTLGFTNLVVRPTTKTLSAGIIKHSGASISGVVDDASSFGILSTIAGTPTQLSIESQADGSGMVISAEDLSSGSSMTVYSIERDQFNNFSSNVAATWSLEEESGAVTEGDLVSAGDNKSATLTGVLVGTAKIRAIANSRTADTGVVTVVPGAVNAGSSLVAVNKSSETVSNGSNTISVTVTAKDAAGNVIPSAAVTVTATGSNNSFNPVPATTNSSGVATVTFSSTKAEAKTISAAIDGTAITQTQSVTFNPDVASRLEMKTQPASTATAGIAFTTQPEIYIVDQFGNLVNDDTTVVTASKNTGSGIRDLLGTLTDTAADGVATFSGLNYTEATSITLDFTAPGLTSVTSTAIAVSPNSASAAIFSTQPDTQTNDTVDAVLTTQPVVLVKDAYDNNVANGTNVVLTKNIGTGALRGDLEVTTVNGTAAFTDVAYSKLDEFSITATAGAATVNSNNAGPLKAGAITSFTLSAPTPVVAGTAFAVSVSGAVDQFSNPASGTVTISATSGGGDSPSGISPTYGAITVTDGTGSTNTTLVNAVNTVLHGAVGSATDDTDTIVVNPAVASQVVVTSNNATLNANGTDSATITGQLKDQYGNIKSQANVSITLTTTKGTLGEAGAQLSGADGTVTSTLTSGGDQTAGIATLSATSAGLTAVNTTVTFVDVTAPAAPVITTPAGAAVVINAANKSGQTLSGTAEAGSSVKIYVNDIATDVTVTATGGNYSFTNEQLQTAGIVSGSDYTVAKVLTLKATDAANNTSVASATRSYTQDTLAPSITTNDKTNTIFSPNGDTIKDTSSFDLLFSEASVVYDINILDSEAVKVRDLANGTAQDPLAKTWDGKNNSDASVANGTYTVQVVMTDPAGNSATDISYNNVQVDTQSPTVALTYSVNPVKAGSMTVTATYNESIIGTPQINIDQQGTTDISNQDMTVSAGSDNKIWTYDYTVNSANGGTYVDGTATVTLSAVADTAGNNAAAPSNNTFTIDTTLPSVEAFIAPSADTVHKTPVPLQFTPNDANAGSNTTCAYVINGGSPASVACTKASAVDTTIPLASFNDGRNTLVISVTDNAGNTVNSGAVSFVVDKNNTLTVDDTAGNNPDFATIQDAINASASGDTISVAAGTYAGNITVAKSLTIKGANAGAAGDGTRGAETIIDGGDATSPVDKGFIVSAGNLTVTIDGFKFTDNSPLHDNYASGARQTTDINFTNNIVSSGNALQTTDPTSNWRNISITRNKFENINMEANSSAVYLAYNKNSIVSNNVFTNINYAAIILISNDTATVSGNSITTTGQQAIQLAGTMGNSTVSDNIITGANTANAADKGGIRLYGADFTGTVNVTGNTVSDSFNGIAIKDGENIAGKDIHVNNNDLAGNTNKGVYHGGTGALDATKNWWGSTAGATIASAITGSVDYRPWRTSNDLTYTVDTLGPTVAVSSSAVSPTKLNPIPVAIHFNESAVDFTADDISVTNGSKGALSGSGADYTINITPTAPGDVTVNINDDTAWDESGNYNSSSNTLTITYDNGAPSGYSVNIDQAYINSANKTALLFTFSGAEIGATYNYTVSNGLESVNDSGTITSATQKISGIDVSSVSDGTLALSVTLTDAALNSGDAATDAIDKDTAAPTFTVSSGTDSGPVQTDTINITVADDNTINSREYGYSADETCDGSDTWGTSFTSGTDFAIIGDRNNYLCVKATDDFNNTGYQLIGHLNTDNTDPALDLGSMFTSQTLTGGNVYPINWTASDTHLGDTAMKVEYSINGGTTWTAIVENSNNDGTENWTVPSVNTSNGKVKVTATDLAGNSTEDLSNTFSITYSVVTDTTAPVATLNSPNGGEMWENNAAHIITWTATDNVTAAGSIKIKLEYSTDGGDNWVQITDNESNDGAYSWTPTGITSSNVLIKITATDAANLTGSDISNTALAVAVPVAYPASICTGPDENGDYSCSVNLSSGWNLISFPIIPASSAITDVLNGFSSDDLGAAYIDTVQYYNGSAWMPYSPAGIDTLTTMEDGKGYWINVKDGSATLTVTGTAAPTAPNPPSTYDVISGWNLIGYKSLTAYQNASSYLSTIPSGYIVFDQNNTNKTSSYLQHGKGYWLWSTGAGSIVAGD